MHQRTITFGLNLGVLSCLLVLGSGCGLDDTSHPSAPSQSHALLRGEPNNQSSPKQQEPGQQGKDTSEKAQKKAPTNPGEQGNQPNQEKQTPEQPKADKNDKTKEKPQEKQGKDDSPKTCQGCRAVIHVRFACEGSSVTVESCKDLSNVVLQFSDGSTRKIEGLKGKQQSFEVEGKTLKGVWVKSGCNLSGDGPGYGEYFSRPAENPSCDGDNGDKTPDPGPNGSIFY